MCAAGFVLDESAITDCTLTLTNVLNDCTGNHGHTQGGYVQGDNPCLRWEIDPVSVVRLVFPRGLMLFAFRTIEPRDLLRVGLYRYCAPYYIHA